MELIILTPAKQLRKVNVNSMKCSLKNNLL